VNRRTMVLATVVAALAAMPALALGGSTRTASNAQTFTDSVGEDAAAPDITSIAVSNDDAGNIVFQVNISNRPALTQDMLLLLFLDTDRNTSTGDSTALGSDYAIQLAPGEVDLFQWNGTDYAPAQAQTSLTFQYATTGATIRVSAAELGKTKGFNFGVDALSGIVVGPTGDPDLTNVHIDLAPDRGHGFFSYEVKTTLTLTVTAFTTSPKPAKAGKSFSAGLAATESDTAGAVQQGAVRCAATIAGKPLPRKSSRLANGIAACVWQIPKTAKGKTIRGTVTLVVQGVQVARSFAAKIT
jgi:hypothetical protein